MMSSLSTVVLRPCLIRWNVNFDKDSKLKINTCTLLPKNNCSKYSGANSTAKGMGKRDKSPLPYNSLLCVVTNRFSLWKKSLPWYGWSGGCIWYKRSRQSPPSKNPCSSSNGSDYKINDNPAEVVIVALGPLTNLALASYLDAEFTSKVEQLFVMCGCIHSKRNHTVTAEFNFCVDPEVAHIFLNEFKSPISLVSWEMCLDHPKEWKFLDRYLNVGTKKADFMKKISTKIKEYEGGGPFIDCDLFPLCEFVLQEKLVHATVDIQGSTTHGQTTVLFLTLSS